MTRLLLQVFMIGLASALALVGIVSAYQLNPRARTAISRVIIREARS